jgi:hypothetical protein
MNTRFGLLPLSAFVFEKGTTAESANAVETDDVFLRNCRRVMDWFILTYLIE